MKPGENSMQFTQLRCEYRTNPLGLDVAAPRLSWVLISDRRGECQTAFQILVAATADQLARDQGELWDSGRVVSNRQNQIEYAGRRLLSRMCCYWKVRVWNKDGEVSAWSESAYWTIGLLDPTDWQAQWIGLDEPRATGTVATPRHLRTEFEVAKAIRRATAYVTALGLYELHLNGKCVGDQLLAPEWTDYHKRVQYQTCDVTGLIQRGANVVGAILGNGWYCGAWQFWRPQLQPIYGADPCFLLQIEVEFADGTGQVICTDGSWCGTTEGPIRFSGIYEGETYDARREMPGWDAPGYDATAWQPVCVRQPGQDFTVGQLVWQRGEPICRTQEVTPVSITEPQPGIYVVDLGQNIGGWCRLRLAAPAGTEVTLRHNEMLNPDGTVYMDNLHAGYLSQGDRQVDRYFCRGGEALFEPHFTYHGFRYVQIHGLWEKPLPGTVTGVVFHSGFRQTGAFTCSHPLLNRLVENIQWSQRGNMMGIPTDCNQRDERCGYSGDANFFMSASVYNFDIAAFFSKWLVDLCQDSQMPGGWFADHAPYYGPGPGPNVGWSEAGILCPYAIYREYGDTRVIREHYAAMKRATEHLISTANPDGTRGPALIGNGDWLNLGGGASKEVIGTAYYAHVLTLMAEMAEVIDKPDDAVGFRRQAEQVRTAFAKMFVDVAGHIHGSSQTGYALAFAMELVPPELKPQMRARFREEIERFNGHLATGFIGTPLLLPALHAAGLDDLAYQLLLNETFPSWLYPVRNGATTVWERWDGWRPETGFADSGMNSFNHYAFGACAGFIFATIGGISPAAPGYQQICIRPVLGPGLCWARSRYDSIIGTIATAWSLTGNRFDLEVTVPVNARATVYLPAVTVANMSESEGSVEQEKGVAFLRIENNTALFAVGAGTHHFSTILKTPRE